MKTVEFVHLTPLVYACILAFAAFTAIFLIDRIHDKKERIDKIFESVTGYIMFADRNSIPAMIEASNRISRFKKVAYDRRTINDLESLWKSKFLHLVK